MRDLNDTAHALRGAGFENVRMGMSPAGRAAIVFTQNNDAIAQQAASLAMRNATHRGVFDATQGTYSNLTVDEHATLGNAFGIIDKNKKFDTFVKQTLEEMNSRGIRIPTTHETLGVRPIEEQVATPRQRSADKIRPEAVAEAAAQQLYEVGDFLKLPLRDSQAPWEVVDVAGSRDADVRNVLLQSTDPALAKLGPLQFTPEALRAAGASRVTSLPLGRSPENYSLASSLEEMLSPELRSAQPSLVESTMSAVQRTGRAEGFSVDASSSTGNITLRQGPLELNFQGLTSIDDAAQFLNNFASRRMETEAS